MDHEYDRFGAEELCRRLMLLRAETVGPPYTTQVITTLPCALVWLRRPWLWTGGGVEEVFPLWMLRI